LACLWIRTYHTAPPVLFDDLRRAVLPEKLIESVDYLLDIKINEPEKMEIAPIKEIDDFINEQVSDIECYLHSIPHHSAANWDRLNRFFVEEIHRDSILW